MPRYSRRRALHVAGAGVATALAGCTLGENTTAVPRSDTDGSRGPEESVPTVRAIPGADETPVPVTAEAWVTEDLPGTVTALAVAGEQLLAGADGGAVLALGPDDGRIRWRFDVTGTRPAEVRIAPDFGYVGGDLYAWSLTLDGTTPRGHLEAVDPVTGRRRWIFEARERLRPVGRAGDTLVVAGHRLGRGSDTASPTDRAGGPGRLHALDRATGEQRWQVDVQGLTGVAVADHGVYATDTDYERGLDETLRAFDLDGEERWQFATGGFRPAPVATPDGVVATADGDGVAKLSPDGQQQWRVGTWQHGAGGIAVTADAVYVGWNPLVRLAHDGRERWRLPDGGTIEAFTDATLYVGEDKAVDAVDLASGTRRWSYQTDYAQFVHVKATLDGAIVLDYGVDAYDGLVVVDESAGRVLGGVPRRQDYGGVAARGRRGFVGGEDHVAAHDVRE